MSNTVENRLKFTTEGLAALTSSKKELEGLGKAGEAAGKQLDGLSSKSESLRKGMTSISTQLEGAKNALLGFAGVQGAGGVLALTDEFKTLNSRLLVTSDTAGQAANRYRELFAVAQQTRAPFSELVDLSSRFATATQGANISQERQINLVRTVSQAMTIGGGSTASMQAALVQLGQAMASGTLRGEELNSILEQAPRLAKALADGLGVSIGELRKLGATGQITSQDILRALEASAGKVASEFGKMVPTVAQSATKLRNAVMDSLGTLDRDLNNGGGVGKFLNDMADGLTRATPQIKDFLKEAKPLLDFAGTLLAIAAVGGASKLLFGGLAAAGGAVAGAAMAHPYVAGAAVVAGAGVAAYNYNTSIDSKKGRLDDKERYQALDQARLAKLQGGEGGAAEIEQLQRGLASRQKTIDMLRRDVYDQRATLPGAGSSSIIGDSFKSTEKIAPRYYTTNQALADLGSPTKSGVEAKYNESLTKFLKAANEDLVRAVDAGDAAAESSLRAKIGEGVKALQRERSDALFGLAQPSSAANQAFRKQVDALEHSYKVSEIALKGQVDVIESRLKRGDLGELQAAQAKFAKEDEVLRNRETALGGQQGAAQRGGFTLEANRYALELQDTAEKRKALALRLAEELQGIEERNVGDLLGLEAKNFQERGQLVLAFIADYQKTYGPALRKALLDGNNSLVQGYQGVYSSGLKQAQEGEQSAAFGLAQARFNARKNELGNSLAGARGALNGSGDGEAYEERLSAAYSALLPLLRDAQKEMRALAGDNEKLVATTEAAGKDITELQLASLRSFGDGMRQANAEYFGAISNMAERGKRVMQDWNKFGEDMFVQFAQTGKLEIGNLTNFIIAEGARMAYQKGFAKPLADFGSNILGKLFGSGGGAGALDPSQFYGVFHSGGIAGGVAPASRSVNPALFSGAPRFHSGGIAGNEVPIIAQRGEGVFTRQQMAALAPAGGGGGAQVVVNVLPTAGQTATVTQRQSSDGLTVDVLLRQIEDGLADNVGAGSGNLVRSIGSRFGIRPQVV